MKSKKEKTTKKVINKEVKEAEKPLAESNAQVEKKTIPLKSGLCLICNDPVNQEPSVYNYACHTECANASGDIIIRDRIKEISA